MEIANALCILAVLFGTLYGILVSFVDGCEGMPLNSQLRMRGQIFYPTLLSVGGATVWVILNVTMADVEGGFNLLAMVMGIIFLGCAPNLTYRLGVYAAKKSTLTKK